MHIYLRLIRYEFEKLFQRKAVWLIILLIGMANIFLVRLHLTNPGPDGYSSRNIAQVYKELEDVDGDKWEAWLGERMECLSILRVRQDERMINYPYTKFTDSLYSEISLLESVDERMDDTGNYQEFLENIVLQSEKMTKSSVLAKPGTFSYRSIVDTPKAYEKLRGQEITAMYSDGIRAVTNFGITDFFIGAVMMTLVLLLIVGEREEGVVLLFRSTSNGRTPSILAKTAVAAILGAAVVIFFYGANWMTVSLVTGMGDLSQPLQSVMGYLESPWKITVLQYMILFFACKIVGLVGIFSAFFCICTWIRNSAVSCLLGIGIFGIEVLLARAISAGSRIGSLAYINCSRVLDTGGYFVTYRNVNVLGWPVRDWVCGLIMTAILWICGVYGGVLVYNHEGSAGIRRVKWLERCRGFISGIGEGRRVHTGLFRHEAYKIWITNKGIWILTVFLGIQLVTYGQMKYFEGKEEYYYRYYSGILSGELNREKLTYLKQEREDLDMVSGEISKLEADYEAGKITAEQLEFLIGNLGYDESKRNAFARAEEQYMTLQKLKEEGDDVSYIDLSGWDVLWGETGLKEDVKNSGKLLIVMILSLSSVFSMESVSGMWEVLNCSNQGRKKAARVKYWAASVFTLTAWGIAFLPRLISVFRYYGGHGMGSNVSSLLMVKGVPFGMSVFLYLTLTLTVSLAGSIFAMTMILTFSKRTLHMITTMFLASILLLLPVVIRIFNLGSEFGLLPLLTGHGYMNGGISQIFRQIMVFVVGVGLAGYVMKEKKR